MSYGALFSWGLLKKKKKKKKKKQPTNSQAGQGKYHKEPVRSQD